MMYGICGWMGVVAVTQASAKILADMAMDCGAKARSDRIPGLQAQPLHVANLGADGVDAHKCLFANDRFVVAVSEALRAPSGKPLTAEDLADRYWSHGEGFLKRVRGPFALALYDRSSGKLVLAVDRAGIRPLYVWANAGIIAFSTRLAALRRMSGFKAEISPQAVFDYLYFHVVPSPGTIYECCEKLLPAQLLIFSGTSRKTSFYWTMPYRDDNPKDFEALSRDFRDLLPKAVQRSAGDLEAVGCFLSGGTDSSTVAGILRQNREAAIRTYSIGFQAQGFDEIEYARIAARHFETDAREFYVEPEDVVNSIPAVAAYCDEPFGNASVVPAYLCARFARDDGMERLLGGDGGDEIFGGNARYANQWIFELYARFPKFLRDILIEPIAFRFPGSIDFPPLRKLRNYITQAKVPLPDRLETYNFLHRTPLAEIFTADFLQTINTESPINDLRAAYARADTQASVNRMMHLDLKITLADNDLRKVNQACGLANIDVRYPLLDDEMMELAATIPPALQLPRTQLRYFFKKSLADFLPREIITKKKHGFGLPVGLWRAEFTPLQDIARESLANLRTREILEPNYLAWLEEKHQAEHASYYGVMLWVLVMLEQWLQAHGH